MYTKSCAVIGYPSRQHGAITELQCIPEAMLIIYPLLSKLLPSRWQDIGLAFGDGAHEP